jgi:hypothetical protein
VGVGLSVRVRIAPLSHSNSHFKDSKITKPLFVLIFSAVYTTPTGKYRARVRVGIAPLSHSNSHFKDSKITKPPFVLIFSAVYTTPTGKIE